jgi:hypothetical protein
MNKTPLQELIEWVICNTETIETQSGAKGGVIWAHELVKKIDELISNETINS